VALVDRYCNGLDGAASLELELGNANGVIQILDEGGVRMFQFDRVRIAVYPRLLRVAATMCFGGNYGCCHVWAWAS
jgi:hypothetical protein